MQEKLDHICIFFAYTVFKYCFFGFLNHSSNALNYPFDKEF